MLSGWRGVKYVRTRAAARSGSNPPTSTRIALFGAYHLRYHAYTSSRVISARSCLYPIGSQ